MAEISIQASEFKARCLALLDEVATTHKTIVITKHGKPAARVVPIGPQESNMIGSIALLADDDASYFSTGKGGMKTSDGAAALLDTHALVWWQADSDRLSRRAAKVMTNASRILVSPISFWELSMLAHKRQIVLDRPVAAWVNDFLAGDRVAVAEFTPSIAVVAGSLETFEGNPADRIIVATAIANGSVLLTKDDKIRAFANSSPAVATLW